MDGVLENGGAARLDVHLRNCPRCVDHERRLIQAQNALVAEFGREPAPGEAAELTLVPPAAAPPAEVPEPTTDVLHTRSLASIVAVSSGVLVLLAGLLVIAALVFALVAVLGL
jgi:anti-sigma factor RsiW